MGGWVFNVVMDTGRRDGSTTMDVRLRQGEYPTLHYVTVGTLELAFSYETVVGFATRDDGWVVSENVWSVTTGKHLNKLPRGDKGSRVPFKEFEARLAAVLAGIPTEVNVWRVSS